MNEPIKHKTREEEYIKNTIGELCQYIEKAREKARCISTAYWGLGDRENETKLKITADILKDLSKTTTKIKDDVINHGSLDSAKVDSK